MNDTSGTPNHTEDGPHSIPSTFSPPPGARFFIAADLDGNDASFFTAPGPKLGTTQSLARDGSPATRLPSAGATEVSREEFEAYAAHLEQPGTGPSNEHNAPATEKSPSFAAYESESGEAAVISSDFAMRMSADGSWKPGGFSAVEGMEKFALLSNSAKATALFHAAKAAHQLLQTGTGVGLNTSSRESQRSREQFPIDTEFWVKESDVPLVRTRDGWFNWFGGKPREYDASLLRVDNSEEVSFDVFAAVVLSSAKAPSATTTFDVAAGTDTTETGKLSTWNLLKELGFLPDPIQATSVLCWNSGNLKLSATVGMGKHFRPVVHLYGPFQSNGSFGFIDHEIPGEATSRELGLALLAHAVDSWVGSGYVPIVSTPWLEEGRRYQSFLPWVRTLAEETADYERRPRCRVPREWLRLGLKTLMRELEVAPQTKTITLSFDGERLSFQASAKPLLLPAEGKAWPSAVVIPAHGLSARFHRLRDDPVTVEVRRDCLAIDRENIAIIKPDTSAP